MKNTEAILTNPTLLYNVIKLRLFLFAAQNE